MKFTIDKIITGVLLYMVNDYHYSVGGEKLASLLSPTCAGTGIGIVGIQKQ